MCSEEKPPKSKRSRRPRCTKEERAAISRANGAKSKGPVTALGKSISRSNGLKHGFRAEVVPLPGEEKGVIENHTRYWDAYYQPQSPGAQALTALCARADVMIKRSYQSLDSILFNQVSRCDEAWDQTRQRFVNEAIEAFGEYPIEAGATLRKSSLGCRWLDSRWAELETPLLRGQSWSTEQRTLSVRLLGARPEPALLREHETAYRAALYSVRCQPVPPEQNAELIALGSPEHRPAALRHLEPAALLPDAAECRAWLLDLVDRQRAGLRLLARELETGIEAEERQRMRDMMKLPREGPESSQFLRYHKEWCSKFFRAFEALPQVLERDASGFYEELAEKAAEREIDLPGLEEAGWEEAVEKFEDAPWTRIETPVDASAVEGPVGASFVVVEAAERPLTPPEQVRKVCAEGRRILEEAGFVDDPEDELEVSPSAATPAADTKVAGHAGAVGFGLASSPSEPSDRGAAASQPAVSRPVTAKPPGQGEPDFSPRTQPDPRALGGGESFAVGKPPAAPPRAGPPTPPRPPAGW